MFHVHEDIAFPLTILRVTLGLFVISAMSLHSLATVPYEILDQIGLFAGTDTLIGPPKTLASLLLVNKRIHSYLSFHSNPLLYAQIFTSKFDTRHVYRRRLPHIVTNVELAEELKARCIYLHRFKLRTDSLMERDLTALIRDQTLSAARIHTLSPGDSTNSMLATAYLMMLENNGLNERQLREYARIEDWLNRYWFDSDGASGVVSSLRGQMWPQNSELNAVAMWLFWMLLKPGRFLDVVLVKTHCVLRASLSFRLIHCWGQDASKCSIDPQTSLPGWSRRKCTFLIVYFRRSSCPP